jgi:peptidoglycan/xylan/chitin deacetylase (PgdA/CDA1 family)
MDHLWLFTLEAIRRRRSVILGYHGLARSALKHDLSRLQVRPARFREQVKALSAAGFTFVTVAELARLAAGGEPPPGYAAISFDDAMHSVYTVAWPTLSELGIRATVYVTVGFIGGTSPWIAPASDNRVMAEREILELLAAGWELGAHTLTHPDLATLDYEAARHEIEGSKRALEQLGGEGVETFAYPFGSYGPESLEATRDSGFIAAVATGGGSWDPYRMTRAMVGNFEPMPLVVLKLADHYESFVDSSAVRPLRQGSKKVRRWAQDRMAGAAERSSTDAA